MSILQSSSQRGDGLAGPGVCDGAQHVSGVGQVWVGDRASEGDGCALAGVLVRVD